MKILKLPLLVTAILFSTALFAADTATTQTANLKIGVVDIHRVLQQSPQVKTALQSLEKEFKPREAKIKAVRKMLEADVQQMKRNGSVMSVKERNKLQDKIFADQTKVQLLQEQFRRDLMTTRKNEMEKILARVKSAVDVVAKAGNYDLVLQKVGVPYVTAQFDITDQVAKKLH